LIFGSVCFLFETGLDVTASPAQIAFCAGLFPGGASACSFRFLLDEVALLETDMDGDDNLLPPEVVAVLLREDRWGGTRISEKYRLSQNVIKTFIHAHIILKESPKNIQRSGSPVTATWHGKKFHIIQKPLKIF
jgi:hypothetical protein